MQFPPFALSVGPRSGPQSKGERRCRTTDALAPLAQLDRASDYESEGQRFKSSRARHKHEAPQALGLRGLCFRPLDSALSCVFVERHLLQRWRLVRRDPEVLHPDLI